MEDISLYLLRANLFPINSTYASFLPLLPSQWPFSSNDIFFLYIIFFLFKGWMLWVCKYTLISSMGGRKYTNGDNNNKKESLLIRTPHPLSHFFLGYFTEKFLKIQSIHINILWSAPKVSKYQKKIVYLL